MWDLGHHVCREEFLKEALFDSNPFKDGSVSGQITKSCIHCYWRVLQESSCLEKDDLVLQLLLDSVPVSSWERREGPQSVPRVNSCCRSHQSSHLLLLCAPSGHRPENMGGDWHRAALSTSSALLLLLSRHIFNASSYPHPHPKPQTLSQGPAS